jgi:hypothetical protein
MVLLHQRYPDAELIYLWEEELAADCKSGIGPKLLSSSVLSWG